MLSARPAGPDRPRPTGMAAADATGSIVLVPDSLRLLGASVPIDGRISWYDDLTGRHVPFNTYLIEDGDRQFLVEAGVPAVFDAVARQMESAFPRRQGPARIAVTRNEPDCVASLPLMVRRFGLEEVHSPGLMNTLQFFIDNTGDLNEQTFAHHATELQMLSFGVRCEPALPGNEIVIGPSRRLSVIAAPLRVLPTVWYYDAFSRTLFCSDTFADETAIMPHLRVITEVERPDALRKRFLHSFTLKFDWLFRSELTSVIADLERIFADHDIERLAPNRGLIVSGYRAVRAKQEALLAALRELQE